LPATELTYFASAAISCAESVPLNAGIPPPPLVTCFVTTGAAGFSESRFGPTAPLAFAAFKVWQPAQLELKSAAPFGPAAAPPAAFAPLAEPATAPSACFLTFGAAAPPI
jgi:hypothetical protein